MPNIVCAAYGGNTEVIRALLEAGADPNAQLVDERGAPVRWASTAVLAAARNGNVNAVRLLLEAGADPNPTGSHYTALTKAASGEYRRLLRNGGIEVVRLLLEAGVNPNVQNKAGETALSRAVHFSHYSSDFFKGLRRLELVPILLEAGADPNVRDEDGNTALHHVARWRNSLAVSNSSKAHDAYMKVWRLLVEAGADPNAKNERGDTPRSIREEKNRQEE